MGLTPKLNLNRHQQCMWKIMMYFISLLDSLKILSLFRWISYYILQNEIVPEILRNIRYFWCVNFVYLTTDTMAFVIVTRENCPTWYNEIHLVSHSRDQLNCWKTKLNQACAGHTQPTLRVERKIRFQVSDWPIAIKSLFPLAHSSPTNMVYTWELYLYTTLSFIGL